MLTLCVVFIVNLQCSRAATPQEVFESRILPIFRSPNPSSCVQCHLSGVDLKEYILPSHRDTFLSLRDQGMIDLDDIAKSRILNLIGRGDDGKATSISQKNREKERAAFVAWLEACTADKTLRDAPKLDAVKQAKPARPVEVIRHARIDRLRESFANNVWALRFRCMNCHSEGTPQNLKLVEKWGNDVAWFRKDGADATLDFLMSSKLIDVDNPGKSLLLLKPLNIEKHGGGVKFEVGDDGYKAMRTFLEDYAAVKKDGYRTAAALPKASGRASFGSDRWIKLTGTPAEWGDKLLQVRIHAWDAKANTWEKEPIATTDRKVFGKGAQWQHNLTLLADADSERAKQFARAPALPRGKYLVKVYVDRDGRLAKDWKETLNDKNFVGQVEITTDWKEGYAATTSIKGGDVK